MAKINVGDHVHDYPEESDAESAGLTPTWIVAFTNSEWTLGKQVGEPDQTTGTLMLTKNLVLAQPDDLTELKPADSE